MEIADELHKLNNVYMEALGIVYLLRRDETPVSELSQQKIDFLLKIIETCNSGIAMMQRRIQVELWDDDMKLEILMK